MTLPLASILIVDDDDVDREKFRRLLASGGLEAEITEAWSGAEALRLVAVQRFDIIVVDYRLGDTTGIELVRAIKKLEQRPLPIIMITGLGDERIAVTAIREGVYEYLTKSNLTTAEIVQTVTSALRSAELERKLAEANAAHAMTEHRLSQSRQQLDDARQLALLGTVHIDVESGEQSWSDEIYRLQGLEPGSCVPSPELFLRRVHPDDVQSLKNAADHFSATREPFRHEHRLLLDDGTVRHLLANGRVIHDANEAPLKLVVLIQDVTALRQAEIAANEREAQIQGLFEACSMGILLTATDGSVLRVNPAMCRLSGYSERELLTMRLIDLVHPEDSLVSGPSTEPLRVVHMDVHDAEQRLQHKDGSSVWVSLNMSPVRNTANAVSEVAVLVQDIRDRRQGENLLRESERRFRTLVTGAPLGIFETDSGGSCTFVNDAWTQISGWRATDVVGQNGIVCVHPQDRATVRAEWERAALERRDFALEFRLLSPDDCVVWVSGTVRSSTDDTGAITGHLGTLMDITERKSQQSSLVAAKDAAEAATRAKADFLAKMSHEIRTPMNSVIGMTDLTLQTALSNEQREFLEMANSAAKSLLHLINDILDFSRAEAGGLSLEHVSFDVRECVGSALRRMQHRAKEKGLELVLALSDAVPRLVIGDPHRLAQILSNLVSNAIKFTDQGKVVVRLNADKFSEDVCTLHFSVSDTGIGVPKDKQVVIFEAFGQADEGVSRKFGGTGLGLAICAQLLELMKGHLWLESEEGRGSNFQFTIEVPFVSAEETPPAGLVTPARLHLSGAHLSILVAEDNQMNQFLIQALLARAGYRVTIVSDGRAALDRLEAEEYDLVLMDVQMPGMSGLEAVERLRAREATGTRHVPVVALTAQAMNGDRERCLKAGMDGYVVKPVDLVELEHVMAQTLTLAAAAQSGEPYDRALLERRVGRDPGLVAELCRLFEPRSQILLSRIRGFIDAREAEQVTSAAHELKGMLLNLAATDAGRIARELEAAGQAARFEEASACLARLVDQVPRLLSALRASV